MPTQQPKGPAAGADRRTHVHAWGDGSGAEQRAAAPEPRPSGPRHIGEVLRGALAELRRRGAQ